MANRNQDFSGNQGDIFRQLETPTIEVSVDDSVDLDLTFELLGACSHALKIARRRGVTREHLVDELNRLLPELNPKITKRKIDAWMARSKDDHPLPAYIVPALCVATQCDLPLRVLANAINYELADQRELLAQELGQAEIQRAANMRNIRTIKARLGSD